MIKNYLQTVVNKNIIVTGDVMLDVFSTGTVDRRSPEAAVDVLDLHTSDEQPGGALNVCRNLVSLGASAEIFAVIGDDFEGFRLEYLCDKHNIKRTSLFREKGRTTTTKTRYFKGSTPLLRVDRELRSPISPDMENILLAEIRRSIEVADACILQDYNKGVLTPRLISEVMDLAKAHAVPVFVDPKIDNIDRYRGAFLIKPNRHEAEQRLGYPIKDIKTATSAAKILHDDLDCKNLLLTLGSDGMILHNETQSMHIPPRSIEAIDITGAGDTVIAVVAGLYASGMPLENCIAFANQAAAEICKLHGVVPVTPKMFF